MDPQATLTSWACTALIIITLGYIGLCVVSPFGKCRKCSGTGRRPGRFTRECHRCDGARRRVRIGRRVWTSLRKYHDGAR